MPSNRIILLCALRREASGLASAGQAHVIGIRACHLQELHLPPQADRIAVLTGFAGALDPALQPGDIVIDDPRGLVSASIDAIRGKIHGSTELIATPADKSRLFQQSGALAVDMESAAVARWTAERGMPLIHVRAISDTARDAVDPRLLRLIDSVGRVKPIRLAGSLLRDPGMIRQLRLLQSQANTAMSRLERVVIEILRTLAES